MGAYHSPRVHIVFRCVYLSDGCNRANVTGVSTVYETSSSLPSIVFLAGKLVHSIDPMLLMIINGCLALDMVI